MRLSFLLPIRPRAVALLLCVTVLAATLPRVCAQTTAEGSTTEAIQSGGLERAFVLHVGKTIDPTRPAALVVVLHGSGGNGKQMERATGFDKIADREGFIVAYPSGIGKHWNDGRRALRFDVVKDVDDVQFLHDLVAAVEKNHKVDARRVFCTGMSNGGFMSNRAGVEASDLFAAIAPVSGTLSVTYADRIKSKFAISVLVIHGSKDAIVPYRGGPIGADGPAGECLGAPEIVAKWVRADQALQDAVSRLLPDTDPNDGCRVTESVHAGPQATVEFLSIDGGIHAWPGGGSKRQGICHDIDGSEIIWGFFKAHPKP
jgi:polyhydroxybutyrate depolymerase